MGSVHPESPWFVLLYEHCEVHGGYAALDSEPVGEPDEGGVVPEAEFTVTADLGHPLGRKGSACARNIEQAAESVCRQLGIDFLAPA